MTDLPTYINNLSLGRIAVNGSANALSMTYLIGTTLQNMISNFTPAFVVSYNNSKYLIAKSVLGAAASVIYYNNQFINSNSYMSYLGTSSQYGIDIYNVQSPNLVTFPWYNPVSPSAGPVAGQSIYSVGAHLMYNASIQTSGTILKNTTYKITLGIVDGTIENPACLISSASLNVSNPSNPTCAVNSTPYIQHTAEMAGDIGDFGPLFAIQNDQATLLGLNVQYAYIDGAVNNYIGTSFAYGKQIINSAIQKVVGG